MDHALIHEFAELPLSPGSGQLPVGGQAGAQFASNPYYFDLNLLTAAATELLQPQAHADYLSTSVNMPRVNRKRKPEDTPVRKSRPEHTTGLTPTYTSNQPATFLQPATANPPLTDIILQPYDSVDNTPPVLLQRQHTTSPLVQRMPFAQAHEYYNEMPLVAPAPILPLPE